MASHYDLPVWQLLIKFSEEFFKSDEAYFHRSVAVQWFEEKYPLVKKQTVHSHLIMMSTNAKGRLGWNIRPKHNVFFALGNGTYRLYDEKDDPPPIMNSVDVGGHIDDGGKTKFLTTPVYQVPDAVNETIMKMVNVLNPESMLISEAEGLLTLLSMLHEQGFSKFDINTSRMELLPLLEDFVSSTDQVYCGPFQKLSISKNEYDSIIACPPFGIKNYAGLTISELLLMYSESLKPDGVGIFVVAPNFFFNLKRSGKNVLEAAGFQVTSCFDIPVGSFKNTGIGGSIVTIEKKKNENMFCSQLQQNEPELLAVIKKWEKFRNSEMNCTFDGIPQLGRTVRIGDYNGMNAIISFYELEMIAKSKGFKQYSFSDVVKSSSFTKSKDFQPFSDVVKSSSFTKSKDFQRLESTHNSIYLPTMYGHVTTRQEDLSEKLKSYCQLVLDENIANAAFVAYLFNTRIGKLMFDVASRGGVMRQISKYSLETLPIFLPNLKFQEQFSSINRRVASIKNELQDYEDEVWRDPQSLPNVISILDSIQSEEKSDWTLNLPFPLASVLRLYQTLPEREAKNRFETLLQFFEVCSQFFSIIHISAWKKNESKWESIWGPFSDNMNEKYPDWEWLKKPGFGVWNEISTTFSKATRELLNGNIESKQMVQVLYASVDQKLITSLTSKKMQNILLEANQIRISMKGHVGFISDQLASETNLLLEELLERFKHEIQGSFSSTFLYQMGRGGPSKGGGYDWDVTLLNGPSTPFFTDEIFLIQPPTDPERLYLGTSSTSEVLTLIPMIKIGPPPESAQTACYFYSATKHNGHRYLSYHHDDSEYVEHDEETQSILNFLQSDFD